MPETKAKVLYKNVLREEANFFTVGGGSTSTLVSGFGAENLTDWRDFSLTKTSSGGTNLDLELLLSDDATFDCFGVYLGSCENAVTVQVTKIVSAVETTLVNEAFTPGQSCLRMAYFPEEALSSGDTIRISIVKADGVEVPIRQVALGSHFEFIRGQHVGLTPTVNEGGVIRKNIISVNGSIVASNVRRIDKKDTIELDWLPPEWVRSEWNPFLQHCVRYPFFRSWDPVGHPTEVDWCAAEDIVSPKNSHVQGKMAVSMPLHCLTR